VTVKATKATKPDADEVKSAPSVDDANAAVADQEPDWRYYPQLSQVSVGQAVALACNIDPACFGDDDSFKYQGTSREYGLRLGIASNHVKGKSLPVIESDVHSTTDYYSIVSLTAFSLWARKMEWTIPQQLSSLADAAIAKHRKETTARVEVPKPQISGVPTWPWGAHSSKLLDALAGAVQEFWTKYDRNSPRSAPTNKKVIKWLEARGVSRRNAEVIAKIIRADDAPRGPRPI
jgi:hypothetical protein